MRPILEYENSCATAAVLGPLPALAPMAMTKGLTRFGLLMAQDELPCLTLTASHC